MQLSITVVTRIQAHHVVPGVERCSKSHGHGFRAEVTLVGLQDRRTGVIQGSEGFEEDVQVLAREFDGRSLNEMLPASQPTALGLAMVFMERLSLAYPRITAVTIWESDDYRASVTRELRI